jgi:hypothetical protein
VKVRIYRVAPSEEGMYFEPGNQRRSEMSTSFADIVEEVKTLSIQEKQDLHQLIEKYLIEARRDEIYDSYARSTEELNQGKLEFSSDTDSLREMLFNN